MIALSIQNINESITKTNHLNVNIAKKYLIKPKILVNIFDCNINKMLKKRNVTFAVKNLSTVLSYGITLKLTINVSNVQIVIEYFHPGKFVPICFPSLVFKIPLFYYCLTECKITFFDKIQTSNSSECYFLFFS